jgi:cobalt-zinc-cadmium efflux system outer membrane protein
MFRSICLLGLLVFARAACADPLTFETALELAGQRAPDIVAEAANVQAARAAWSASGTLPDPKLLLGVENLPATGANAGSFTRDFMTMRRVGVMQDVPNAAKRRAEIAAAAASVTQAETQQRVTVLTVRQETALAWLDRYYLERRLELLDAVDRDNRLLIRSVQARFAAGRGDARDVIAPKQEAADLADRRDELESRVAIAKGALRRWVGDAADAPLAGDAPSLALDPAHLRDHVHEHPELAVVAAMIDVAQAELHEAESSKRPDWGVELSYGRRGGEFSDMVSVQFTVGLPVFSKSRQDPRIAEKHAQLMRIEAQRDSMLHEHIADLATQLAEYGALRHQLERVEAIRLPLAEEKVALQLAAYRNGTGDLPALFAARRELLDERVRRIDLTEAQALVSAKLHFIYGEDAV